MSDFKNLFQWNGNVLEDVRFWCEPELTAQAIAKIPSLGFSNFDGIATFEARGFFLAGVATPVLKVPTVLFRKHKRFYDKMDHQRIDFMNWKNEAESLTVLKKSLPSVKRVIVVDDIFDTGNSLKAGVSLLKTLNIEIVGAYYMLNAGSEEALSQFNFPIKATLKHKLF